MSFSLVNTNWFRFALPWLLLAFIGLGMDNIISLTQANIGIVSKLPVILFTITIILSNVFKQSRIGMVASVLLVSYWIIQERLQSPLSSETTIFELSLLAGLMPIALASIYSYKDSSLFTPSFAAYLLVIAMFVYWSEITLAHFYPKGVENINETFLFIWPSVSRLPFILVFFLTGMCIIFANYVLNRNTIIDATLYSTSLFTTITFIGFHISYISSTMFSLAGILLLLYLLCASYELAFMDTLTEIPGRLALESDLKHLGRKYTIAMLDIDHFKLFNDTYGHDTGDNVLKLVASQLQQVGGRAKVYRYGGEEFTVLFKGKTTQEASEYLEQLRASIEQYQMILRNEAARPKDNKIGEQKRCPTRSQDSVSVTISIGAADSSESRQVSKVIKAADNALYKAKKSGRNRVCLNGR